MRLGFRNPWMKFVARLRWRCPSLEIWIGRRGFYTGPRYKLLGADGVEYGPRKYEWWCL